MDAFSIETATHGPWETSNENLTLAFGLWDFACTMPWIDSKAVSTPCHSFRRHIQSRVIASMHSNPSLMRKEIDEIPHMAAQLIENSRSEVTRIANQLREADPTLVATVARGSSDHVAGFLKYAIELETGLPVASLGPSIASVYERQMRLSNCATIAISQSGKSPDIISMVSNARRGGSLTIALTNVISSPLVMQSNLALDILAGPELSVAATKSFVNSAIAGLLILAQWTENNALQNALQGLPDALSNAVSCDWTPLGQALQGRNSLYILGRGPSFPIAGEAALKFKETSNLHAEAYSAAEVMHGPVSIVSNGFPVLVLAARDKAEAKTIAVCDQLVAQGANVFVTSSLPTKATTLPFAKTNHGITDALVQIVSFYGFAEMLSRHRGLNPDSPNFLAKVTETI
jgi:glutamine---fructose-6-phosphate transaminase (isomerizing)